jgi:hypothetical protein
MSSPELKSLAESFESLPVDGYVELDDNGHLFVELFASAIRQRGFRAGQFVRMRIVSEEELKATQLPDTSGNLPNSIPSGDDSTGDS